MPLDFPQTRVPLPNVKFIKLSSHVPQYSSQFLAHLLLPRTANVEVNAVIDDSNLDDLRDSLERVIPINFKDSLPMVKFAEFVSLVVFSDQYRITSYVEPPAEGAVYGDGGGGVLAGD